MWFVCSFGFPRSRRDCGWCASRCRLSSRAWIGAKGKSALLIAMDVELPNPAPEHFQLLFAAELTNLAAWNLSRLGLRLNAIRVPGFEFGGLPAGELRASAKDTYDASH